jgi:hypothetical protein
MYELAAHQRLLPQLQEAPDHLPINGRSVRMAQQGGQILQPTVQVPIT